ncbi:DUF6221 family protein [Nonomuraea terrae]|uniref:DUF6221 family protein n=1 Tax=Nonomuraea terrae TaxID=2530383 RepID=UPI0037B0AAE5
MDDLVVFVRARLDEEEAIALTAGADPECGVWAATRDGVDFDQYEVDGIHPATAAHIVRHDPARVLREVAAKRSILDRHKSCGTGVGYCDDGGHGPSVEDSEAFTGCSDLKDLATPYADHRDYRREWAPDEADN